MLQSKETFLGVIPLLMNPLMDELKKMKILLLMKGAPSFPMCGLSGNTCLILKKYGIKYGYFDVLKYPEIYFYLKNMHKPCVAPYLYINSNFIGGYNEITSKAESGELMKALHNNII